VRLKYSALLAFSLAIGGSNSLHADELLPIGVNTSAQCDAYTFEFQLGRSSLITSSDRLSAFRTLPQNDPDMMDFEHRVLERLYWWTAVVIREPDKAPKFASKIYDQLMELDAADGATRVLVNDRAMQNLVHKDFLLTVAYAILAIKETAALETSQVDWLTDFLRRRIDIANYQRPDLYGAAQCFSAMSNTQSVGGCQNHAIGHQHLRTMWGAIAGDANELDRGRRMWEFAINDLTEDGALWREAVRGAYSWSYYSHALNNLMAIADLLARSGKPVWDYENPRGQTIHDAVAFYTRSLADPENPDLMWRYAQANQGMNYSHAEGANPRSLTVHARVLERLWYTEWFPIYRTWFPDHPNTTHMAALYTGDRLPRTSNHTGLNTWCTMPGGLD
jgi:hypothetical protein